MKRAKPIRGKQLRRELRAVAVLQQFRIIFGAVRRHFREVEKACGLPGSQAWMLREISTDAGIGISELAARLLVHTSTASLLVDRLVRSGHVVKVRRNDDQRRVGLRATIKGTTVLRKLPGPAEGVLPRALLELPDQALLELHLHLDRLIAQMDTRDDADATRPLSDL
jgi:DNA-binding MarR family transcriptional regulator